MGNDLYIYAVNYNILTITNGVGASKIYLIFRYKNILFYGFNMVLDNIDLTHVQIILNLNSDTTLIYDNNNYLNNDKIKVIEEEKDLKYKKYTYEYNMANSIGNNNTHKAQ